MLIEFYQEMAAEHHGLENSSLEIHQSIAQLDNQSSAERDQIIEGLISDNEHLRSSDKKIIRDLEVQNNLLQDEITSIKGDTIPLRSLRKEILALYPSINKITYGRSIDMDTEAVTDTIETFIVGWKRGTSSYAINLEKKRLNDWLLQRIDADSVRVLKY